LLRVILDDPEPIGRFLRRGQLLALRCLVDGAAVAGRALLDQLFSDGESIGRSSWLGIPIQCIRLLKQLSFTRHEAEAQRMLGEIEEAAKRELSEGAYLTVYAASHGLPAEPRDCAPGTLRRKDFGGRRIEVVLSAWEKRVADPAAWFAEALKSVRSPKTALQSRLVLISLLGEEADTDDKARRTLKELLVRDRLPEIRAACAEALEEAGLADSTVAKVLLERLDQDDSDVVREQCAEALVGIAPHQRNVEDRLEELFASGQERVRAGAAIGLARLDLVVPERHELLQRFLTTITSPEEPARVRCACIWAIASLLGREGMTPVNHAIEECLDDRDPHVSRAALHVLADAIAEGRREWSSPLVEKIETMLMAVAHPCPHLYHDLVMFGAAKEIHGGHRLERLLGDALTSFDPLIRIAFVFGSVARVEQVRDSDIDLMIVGDIRFRDLAVTLHTAEATLGRTVNPVLFSPEKFREQYREGNPFLLDVVRKEKIFLKGSSDDLTELVADRATD
jgi:predicted nucleotidyltransferase